jgi:hypothetical protein
LSGRKIENVQLCQEVGVWGQREEEGKKSLILPSLKKQGVLKHILQDLEFINFAGDNFHLDL